MWALHGLLAVTSDDRIELPAIDHVAASYIARKGETIVAPTVAWPHAATPVGTLDIVQPASSHFAAKLYASDIPAARAWASAAATGRSTSPGTAANSGTSASGSILAAGPRPGDVHHVALEPTTAPVDHLGQAIEQRTAIAAWAPGALPAGDSQADASRPIQFVPRTPDMTEEPHILYTMKTTIAHMVMNRPAKLNAITAAMGGEFVRSQGRRLSRRHQGAGYLRRRRPRLLSAGSDVNALDDLGDPWEQRNRAEYDRDYIAPLLKLRKPSIAAIDGYCLGGGLEVAMSCDIRVATDRSRFGAPEVQRGWHAGSGNTSILPRLIGYGNAARWILTGDIFRRPRPIVSASFRTS